MAVSEKILSIENLNIDYQTSSGYFRAVNGVSLQIGQDEVFGIVGESGSGKSTLCNGFLRLLPGNSLVTADHMDFQGQEILKMKEREFRHIRWEQISYIPQSAMNTLNPILTIGQHFYETIEAHEGRKSREELHRRTTEALARVNLQPEIAHRYAHELSGGMKQRVCIAMATLLSPKLIVADEPTSALDVISQKSVLQILSAVRKNLKASMIMIGHDMALQAQISHRMGIMYAGYFVEIGSTEDIFHRPVHPYTQGLIRAIPSIRRRDDISALAACELSEKERLRLRTPRPLREVSAGHFVADYS